MSSYKNLQRKVLILLAGLSSAGLLLGCASSTTKTTSAPVAVSSTSGDVVSGTGTPDNYGQGGNASDRAAVKTSNDQIYNTEHAPINVPQNQTTNPNGGIP
jgi:hypothetical protein